MRKLLLRLLVIGILINAGGCSIGCWVRPKNKSYKEAIKDYCMCVTTTENSYREPFGVLIYVGRGRYGFASKSYGFNNCMEHLGYAWLESAEGFEVLNLDPLNKENHWDYPQLLKGR